MLDVDTFLTTLYVIVDDFCQSHRPRTGRPGPEASLCRERGHHPLYLRPLVEIRQRERLLPLRRGPSARCLPYPARPLPVQPPRALLCGGHRGDRRELGQIAEGRQLIPTKRSDSSAMPVRDAKRRGHGWLAGRADIGWSNSIGWYEGFSLLAAVEPTGVITGFCFGSASTADQPLAETFFDVRANPNPRLISVGSAFSGTYVADKGFEGAENHRRWLECYGAEVIHPPKRNSKKRSWSKRLRRWVAGIRQIVETVYDKLFNTFGLWRERPHEIEGLRARLAARVALHNFCIWLNDHLGRPRLKFADLMGW